MRYVWDKERGWIRPQAKKGRSGPYIMKDTPAYRSPLGTGIIEGRAARREDLKRGGCREVDPSEALANPTKTQEQARRERAYLDSREQHGFSPEVAERLMNGH